MYTITARHKWKSPEGGAGFEAVAEDTAATWKEACERLTELLKVDIERAQAPDALDGGLEQFQLYQRETRQRGGALEATFYGRYRVRGKGASLVIKATVEGPDIGQHEARSFKTRCTRFLNENSEPRMTMRGLLDAGASKHRRAGKLRDLAKSRTLDDGTTVRPITPAPSTKEPDTCPACGSGDVEMADFAFATGAVHVEMRCASCGETYLETYRFESAQAYAHLSR